MGWGEVHTPAPPSMMVLLASSNLAEAVRRWKRSRTTGDEEKVLEALESYDLARNQPW